MKILYFVPNPPSAIRVRSHHLIRHLRNGGHDVTVACLWTGSRERGAVASLARQGPVATRRLPRWRSAWNALGAVPSGGPLQAAFPWHPGLFRDLLSRVRDDRFDLVHLEHLRGARYGRRLVEALGAGPRPAVVWDSVDCISHLFAQAVRGARSPLWRGVARWELPRTRRAEASLSRLFDRVLVTSRTDRAALEALTDSVGRGDAHSSRIRVVPNGVDLEYFGPGPETPRSQTVVLTGKMSYHANVTAALRLVDDVMPSVWQRRPEARVVIAGQGPPRSVRRLAVRHGGRVTVTGAVDDLRPFLWDAGVAAAPISYGAGIQNKVLEAMACGTPVVASPTAVSALGVTDGRHVRIGGGAAPFARAILDLLEDPARARALGREGRLYVEREHTWRAAGAALEEAYREALREAHAPAAGSGVAR